MRVPGASISLSVSLSGTYFYQKWKNSKKQSLPFLGESTAMQCKTQAKISKSSSTSGLSSVSERVGAEVTAAGMLGNHGKIQGRAVQDPLGAAAGGRQISS